MIYRINQSAVGILKFIFHYSNKTTNPTKSCRVDDALNTFSNNIWSVMIIFPNQSWQIFQNRAKLRLTEKYDRTCAWILRTIFPFPLELSRVISYWQFSLCIWTKRIPIDSNTKVKWSARSYSIQFQTKIEFSEFGSWKWSGS